MRFFQPAIEKAQLHALHGDQLIQSNHYAVDSIRPKCVELRRVCDDFSNEAKKKTDILSKSLQIHVGIDKVRIRQKTSHPQRLWAKLNVFVSNLSRGFLKTKFLMITLVRVNPRTSPEPGVKICSAAHHQGATKGFTFRGALMLSVFICSLWRKRG